MYHPSADWTEQVKNIGQEISNSKNFVLEGIVTSVNQTAPYMVKVNLEPYGIETGWLKIATPYIGPGYGFIFPAPPEGTAVKVVFSLGNINDGEVIAGVYNDDIMPPNVPYGTVGIVDPNGSKIMVNSDSSVELDGPGGSYKSKADGTTSITGKTAGSITIGTDGLVTIVGKTSSQSW